jgi:hypothetical protein
MLQNVSSQSSTPNLGISTVLSCIWSNTISVFKSKTAHIKTLQVIKLHRLITEALSSAVLKWKISPAILYLNKNTSITLNKTHLIFHTNGHKTVPSANSIIQYNNLTTIFLPRKRLNACCWIGYSNTQDSPFCRKGSEIKFDIKLNWIEIYNIENCWHYNCSFGQMKSFQWFLCKKRFI